MTTLKPKPGFDWRKVTWGRPDSVPTILCSYCSASLPEDSVPLIMSNAEGWTVRFCDKCMERWWGFEPQRTCSICHEPMGPHGECGCGEPL